MDRLDRLQNGHLRHLKTRTALIALLGLTSLLLSLREAVAKPPLSALGWQSHPSLLSGLSLRTPEPEHFATASRAFSEQQSRQKSGQAVSQEASARSQQEVLSSLEKASRLLADRAVKIAAPSLPSSTALAVSVISSDTETQSGLATAAQTTVIAALGRKGFQRILPLKSVAPEAAEDAARASGVEFLLRLTVRLVRSVRPEQGDEGRAEAGEIVLAGDMVPTWVNFWAGRDQVRAQGGADLAVRAAADSEAFALAGPTIARSGKTQANGTAIDTSPTAGGKRFVIRQLARLPEKVVAIAAGDLDSNGKVEIAALSASRASLLQRDGQTLAVFDQTQLPRASAPAREPAGAIAIARFNPSISAPASENPRLSLGFLFSGKARGTVLELLGNELKPVKIGAQNFPCCVPGADRNPSQQAMPAAPLCAGSAGLLLSRPMPGKNSFSPELRLVSASPGSSSNQTAALPFEPVAVAANPRVSQEHSFVAVSQNGEIALLSANLRVSKLQLIAGSGIALGDIDGDGTTELIYSAGIAPNISPGRPSSAALDKIKVVSIAEGKIGAILFESEPIAANIVSATSADLDGDGRDEALFAAWEQDGSTSIWVLRSTNGISDIGN